MQIVTKKLSALKPAPYNPRAISDKAMAGLRASINKYGLVEPIVWNKRSGNIVGGHKRLEVLEEQGVAKTKVVVVDLPKREEKALNVALNNPHVTGEFTPDLQNILAEFKVEMPDVFAALNFDELYRPGPKEGKTDPDNVPEAKARVKMGEIWQLGKHCVMCGDSTKAEDVEKLMQGEKADMAFTDPPYNVGKDYGENVNDLKAPDEYKAWSKLWFSACRRFVDIIVFTPGTVNLFMWAEIEKPKWVGVWVKRNQQSSSSLQGYNAWEPILFYGKVKCGYDVWGYSSS